MNEPEVVVKSCGVFKSFFVKKKGTEKRKLYLENVISRFHVSNVDPLAVNVMPVGVPAAHSNPLVSKVSTLIPFFNTCNKTL